MGAPGANGPAGPWASASDLADYAYCPRSHYYRHHPPRRGPSTESRRSSEAGRAFHATTLARVERRERSYGAWALVAFASALFLVALSVGAVLGWWGLG